MQNIVLIVHLLLALALIVVVLLQRSEGGGLGMGGGGGGSGIMTGRQAANALTKLTWAFAAAFICTSIALTILSAQQSGGGSVLDRLGIEQPAAPAGTTAPVAPEGNLLPPPATGAPAAPPRAD